MGWGSGRLNALSRVPIRQSQHSDPGLADLEAHTLSTVMYYSDYIGGSLPCCGKASSPGIQGFCPLSPGFVFSLLHEGVEGG